MIATVYRIVVASDGYAHQQLNTVRRSPAESSRTSSYSSIVTQK